MPAWGLSLNSTEIRLVAVYELSFVFGSARTISGGISDAEGDNFAQTVLNVPPISGTTQDFQSGKSLFTLYCAQCHGDDGQSDGPASVATPGGYISPVPANFTESGRDFQYYGRYVWKVREGVETTNMPPWKWALNDNEIYKLVFYVQSFAAAEDYNAKWGPQYSDAFARNLKNPVVAGSFVVDFKANPVGSLITFLAVMLWNLKYEQLTRLFRAARVKTLKIFSDSRRLNYWI